MIPARLPEDKRRLMIALLSGFVIESLALGLALRLSRTPPAAPKPAILSLVMVETPPKPTPPAPRPAARPAPTPAKMVQVKPQPVRQTPERRVVHAASRRPVPTPAPADAPPDAPVLAAPKPTPPPPAPPPASSATPTEIDNFIAAMNQAVQAALRYPNVARVLDLTGTTTLGFDDRDGVISAPRVVRSSGSTVLDQAALAALADAVFPAMPAALRGRTQSMVIDVVFTEE